MIWNSAGLMILVAVVAALLLAASPERSTVFPPLQEQQDQEEKRPAQSDFMIVKLDMARDVVAGLASADFEKIANSANEMKKLSMESGWNVQTTPAYLKLSSEFRDSAERLRKAAEKKNIDGSTLAYFEVTLNCVRCHKYIRDK